MHPTESTSVLGEVQPRLLNKCLLRGRSGGLFNYIVLQVKCQA